MRGCTFSEKVLISQVLQYWQKGGWGLAIMSCVTATHPIWIELVHQKGKLEKKSSITLINHVLTKSGCSRLCLGLCHLCPDGQLVVDKAVLKTSQQMRELCATATELVSRTTLLISPSSLIEFAVETLEG